MVEGEKERPKEVLVFGEALTKDELDMNTRWEGGVHSCIDQTQDEEEGYARKQEKIELGEY
jgi:hypothetical protein